MADRNLNEPNDPHYPADDKQPAWENSDRTNQSEPTPASRIRKSSMTILTQPCLTPA